MTFALANRKSGNNQIPTKNGERVRNLFRDREALAKPNGAAACCASAKF